MFHFVECLVEPWLCEVDIEFGHNFVAKIEEGLRDADLTVLFSSPEAARSNWTQLEWTSVTAREISESRTHLGVRKQRSKMRSSAFCSKSRVQ
jgi:hypothetical protein